MKNYTRISLLVICLGFLSNAFQPARTFFTKDLNSLKGTSGVEIIKNPSSQIWLNRNPVLYAHSVEESEQSLADAQKPKIKILRSSKARSGGAAAAAADPAAPRSLVTVDLNEFKEAVKRAPYALRWKAAQAALRRADGASTPLGVYRAALDAYRAGGRWREGARLVRQMRRHGPPPDKYCYDKAIGCCQRTAAFSAAAELLGAMQRDAGLIPPEAAGAPPANETAPAVAAATPNPEVTPDLYTYRGVLNAANTSYPVAQRVKYVRNQFAKRDLAAPPAFFEGAVRQALYEGAWPFALRLVLRDLPERGLTPTPGTYSVLVNALCAAGKWARALEVFAAMTGQGLRPDRRTYANAIQAAARTQDPERAALVYAAMVAAGHAPDEYCRGHLALAWQGAGAADKLVAFCLSADAHAALDARDPFIFAKAMHVLAGKKYWRDLLKVFERCRGALLPVGGPPRLGTIEANLALKAHAKLGQWREAAALVTALREAGLEVDLVGYNTAIHAAGRAGELYEALSLLEEADEVGLRPDARTFTALLAAAARPAAPAPRLALRILALLGRFHLRATAEMVELALRACRQPGREDRAAALEILEELAAGKEMGEKAVGATAAQARLLLEEHPQPAADAAAERVLAVLAALGRAADAEAVAATAWPSDGAGGPLPRTAHQLLIGAHVGAGDAEGLRQSLKRMVEAGHNPTSETLAAAAAALGRARRPYPVAEALIDLASNSGHFVDLDQAGRVPLYEAAVGACARRPGGVSEAWLLLCAAMREDILVGEPTYAAVLRAAWRGGQHALALSVLGQMREHYATPTAADYRLGLKAAAAAGDLAKARASLDMMEADGLAPDARTYRAVLKIAARQRDAPMALEVFRRMDTDARLGGEGGGGGGADGPAYHHLLGALAGAKRWAEIPAVVREMKNRGVPVLEEEYGLVMQVWAKKGRWQDALAAMNELKAAGLEPTLKTCNVALDAISHTGQWKLAEAYYKKEILRRGLKPDEVTYGTLIYAYAEGGQPQKALDALAEMRPGAASLTCYNNALHACKEAGWWEQAVGLFDEMEKRKLQPSSYTYSALISACEKAEAYGKAVELFFKMQNANVEGDERTYNAVISACFKAGMPELANKLLEEMREKGVPPSLQLFTTVAAAAARTGNVPLARQLFPSMEEAGVAPTVQIFTAAMTACLRGGEPRRALKFFEKLGLAGLKPNKVSYAEALKACQAEQQWGRLVELFEEMVSRPDVEPEPHSVRTAMLAYNRLGQFYKTLMIAEALKAEEAKKQRRVAAAATTAGSSEGGAPFEGREGGAAEDEEEEGQGSGGGGGGGLDAFAAKLVADAEEHVRQYEGGRVPARRGGWGGGGAEGPAAGGGGGGGEEGGREGAEGGPQFY